MDQLKIRPTLATGKASTLLLCAKEFAADTNKNAVVPLTASDKKTASDYDQDQVRPRVVSITYNQQTGEIEYTFSEAFSLSTFNAKYTSFASQKTSRRRVALEQLSLKGDGIVTFNPLQPHKVSYKLTKQELEAMQQLLKLCDANIPNSCFLSVSSLMFSDTSGLAAQPVKDLEPSTLFPDKEPPVLDNFDLDMTTLTLVLSFSETVQLAALDVQKLAFLSCSNLTTCTGVPLSSGQFSTAVATEVSIVLSNADANKIKANAGLCTSADDTFLQIKDDFIRDVAGVALVTPKTAKKVTTYTKDTKPPTITATDLNMDGSGRLVLKFSESVNVSSINLKEITIQNSRISPTKFKLTGGVPLSLDKEPDTVIITLLKDNLDAIKKLSLLAVSRDTSFISVTSKAISDMAGNPVTAITSPKAEKVDAYDPDKTRPKIIGYDIDMTTGTLRLKFSETVDADSLDPKGITLHDCAP